VLSLARPSFATILEEKQIGCPRTCIRSRLAVIKLFRTSAFCGVPDLNLDHRGPTAFALNCPALIRAHVRSNSFS
jgi:hypothetical protein